MSMAKRITGLLFAVAVGAGLYHFWPDFWALVRNRWLGDLRFPIMLIYAIGGLWIAEKLWGFVDARWGGGES